MNRRSEDILKAFADYEREGHGDNVDLDEFAAWLIHNRKWMLEPQNIFKLCRREIARVFRQQYIKDRKGRKVRAKIAIRDRQGKIGWNDLRTVSHPRMRLNAGQRRKMAECEMYQLHVDLEHYQDIHPERGVIQISFDLTRDIAIRDLEYEEDPILN